MYLARPQRSASIYYITKYKAVRDWRTARTLSKRDPVDWGYEKLNKL